jgi:hypothetical protein
VSKQVQVDTAKRLDLNLAHVIDFGDSAGLKNYGRFLDEFSRRGLPTVLIVVHFYFS